MLVLQKNLPPIHRIPDLPHERAAKPGFGISREADLTELTAAVLDASMIERVIKHTGFPGLFQPLHIPEELLVPALDHPGRTVGDCLHGFVFGFQDGDSPDKEALQRATGPS